VSEIQTFDQTRSTSTAAAPELPTKTRTISELVQDIGWSHNRTRILGDDVADLRRQSADMYRDASDILLDQKARDLVLRPAVELLAFLAGAGFAWRDIARMIGVSVPAVRKWRLGESPTSQNLFAIAKTVALVEILQHELPVTDVAAWMEIPPVVGAPTNPIDLVSNGFFTEVIGLALDHLTPEELIERHVPDWQERYQSNFEVFEASDGELGIRPKSNGDH
jgi:transcriptional regulator with XRE-family HTH domain